MISSVIEKRGTEELVGSSLVVDPVVGSTVQRQLGRPLAAPSGAALCPKISQGPSSLPLHLPHVNELSSPVIGSNWYGASAEKIRTSGCTALASMSEPCLEGLFHEIMLAMFRDAKDLLVVQSQILKAENSWREMLYREVEAAHATCDQAHVIRGFSSSIGKYFGPFGVFAAGVVGLASGATGILPIAALALGGILLLDTILDDAGKKAVSGWLARGDQEAEAAWVGRIHFASSALAALASFGLAPSRALAVVMSVSNVALTSVRAVGDIQTNRGQALLTEVEQKLDMSKIMLDGHIETLKKMDRTMKQLFADLAQTYQSLRATTSMIRG